MQRGYQVGELKRIIKESANEFKPLVYNDENEKINREAYKEMAKANEDGDPRKAIKNPRYPNTDNKGMHNLEYENMNDKFKEDNKSRVKGYVNKQAEDLHKNDPFGNADFHDIDGLKGHHEEIKDGEDAAKTMGLTSRELDKKKLLGNRESFVENKIAKLTFKNTTFLTEEHMLSRVPDHYKMEGKKFIMRDKNNNEYLVEWHVEDGPKVENRTAIRETNERIKQLFNYTRKETNTTNAIRLNENKNVDEMLNKVRKLMK